MRIPTLVMTIGLMTMLSAVTAAGVAQATRSVLPDALAQVSAVLAQVDAQLRR